MLVELKSTLSTDSTVNGDLTVQNTESLVAPPKNWNLVLFHVSTDMLGSDLIL